MRCSTYALRPLSLSIADTAVKSRRRSGFMNILSLVRLSPQLVADSADNFIQKTKKLYDDTNSQRNLSKVDGF
jgi:hypothetical protein